MFRTDRTLIDLQGNQAALPEDNSTFIPLQNGMGISFSSDCQDQCKISLVSPFQNETERTYTLPWAARISRNPLMNVLTEDQSLIVSTRALARLSTVPAIVKDYPDFPQYDRPIFRLMPNGEARLRCKPD